MANYRKHNRNQVELKTMCINDFVPKNHKARIIVSIVEELDLSLFDDYYKNDTDGRRAYPIKELLSLLIYSFLEGTYTSRKIERKCNEDIVYRYLCCDDPPDNTTISRFWQRFKDQIEKILIQTVYIGETEGLIDYKHLSGDGVKIKSIGSKSKMISIENSKKMLSNIEKNISKLIEKIDTLVESKDKQEIIEKISDKEKLRSKIIEGIKELENIQSQIKKNKKEGIKEQQTNYYHIIEKDPRIIKKRDTFISGYNAQTFVDSKTNMVIACDVTSTVSDVYNGKPLMEKVSNIVEKEKLREAEISFDFSYLEEDLLKYGAENNLNLFVATGSTKNMNKDNTTKKISSRTKELTYNEEEDVYICKNGNKLINSKRISWVCGIPYHVYERTCSKCRFISSCFKKAKRKRRRKLRRLFEDNPLIDKNDKRFGRKHFRLMKEKMSKEESKKIYSKRFYNIEPVFAHIEEHRSFRRFTVWGKEKANAQWKFVCFVHNIFKIIKYSKFARNVA